MTPKQTTVMANITYYKGTKKLVVSEMSARLSPPEKSGWSRTEGKEVTKVPEITKKFMDNSQNQQIEAPVLPFLAEPDTGKKETVFVEPSSPPVPEPAPIMNEAPAVDGQKPSLAPRPGAKAKPATNKKPGRKPKK